MADTKPEVDEHFARLVSGGLDRAYRLAGLILGQAADAEDVAHDAAIRAWQSVGSLRDPGSFEAWFDRIVVNACRDRIRRNRRIRFVELQSQDERPDMDPFRSLFDMTKCFASSGVFRPMSASSWFFTTGRTSL